MENVKERRQALKAKILKNNSGTLRIVQLTEKLVKQFEVKKYVKDRKFDIITLSNVIHKIVTDKDTTAKVLTDLQETVSVDLALFAQLRLAIGWTSFISPMGVPITARPGNAELAVDLLHIIDEEFGNEPHADKYAEFTQEYLDARNVVAQEIQASADEENDAYQDLLDKLKQQR